MNLQVDEEPYRSILAMLQCYPSGLELKHLSYELVAKTIKNKGTPRVLKEDDIKKYLKEQRRKGFFYKNKIKPGCVKSRQHLNNSLKILLRHQFIVKGWKKYYVKPLSEQRLTMNHDLKTLKLNYINAGVSYTLISTDRINIYHPVVARKYYENEGVKRKIDGYVKDFEKLIDAFDCFVKQVEREDDIDVLKELESTLDASSYVVDRIDGDRVYTDKEKLDGIKKQMMEEIMFLKERIEGEYDTPNTTLVIHSRGTRKIAEDLSRTSK